MDQQRNGETSDLEEVERPDGGVVQPHVLPQLQRGQTEGVEVGLVRQQLQETDDGSQAGHGNLGRKPRQRDFTGVGLAGTDMGHEMRRKIHSQVTIQIITNKKK